LIETNTRETHAHLLRPTATVKRVARNLTSEADRAKDSVRSSFNNSHFLYGYPGRRQLRGYGFYLRLSVSLFFCTTSPKPMQLGSPNLT